MGNEWIAGGGGLVGALIVIIGMLLSGRIGNNHRANHPQVVALCTEDRHKLDLIAATLVHLEIGQASSISTLTGLLTQVTDERQKSAERSGKVEEMLRHHVH